MTEREYVVSRVNDTTRRFGTREKSFSSDGDGVRWAYEVVVKPRIYT
jgi:hypothetical protein